MSAHCHSHDLEPVTTGYRKILVVVMLLNLAMFIVEISAGLMSGSTSLLADALDFGGDAATYGISLFVLGKHLHMRAKASLLKAGLMGLFAFWVIGTVIYQYFTATVPKAEVMGAIGILALFVNVACVIFLYRYREGDSNMLSVWLCSRNDAIGNIAVVGAAIGVYLTGSALPDLLVALGMGCLGLSGASKIAKKALHELKHH